VGTWPIGPDSCGKKTRRAEQTSVASSEIDVKPPFPARPNDRKATVAKGARDLLPDFIAARANRRPEGGVEIASSYALRSRRRHGRGDDVGDRSPPTCVNRCRPAAARIDEEDRHAVRRCDRSHRAAVNNEGVRLDLGVEARRKPVDGDHLVPVYLPEPHDGNGSL